MGDKKDPSEKVLADAVKLIDGLESQAPCGRLVLVMRLGRMWLKILSAPEIREHLTPADAVRELVGFAGLMAAPFIGRNEAIGVLIDGFSFAAEREAQIQKMVKKKKAEGERTH